MKRCAACVHKDRDQIDRDIICGVPYSIISHKYGIKEDCLRDHKRYKHLSKVILEAHHADEIKHGLELTSLLEEISEIALGSAKEARAAKDYRAIGGILSTSCKVAEILSRASPGDKEESGLQAMRAELKAMREDHVETPTA